ALLLWRRKHHQQHRQALRLPIRQPMQPRRQGLHPLRRPRQPPRRATDNHNLSKRRAAPLATRTTRTTRATQGGALSVAALATLVIGGVLLALGVWLIGSLIIRRIGPARAQGDEEGKAHD
ncbi:MAG TPA: hypothetical protein VKQ36_15435, partial [Ktedonobacterales bacterium]|nr:hypothetical protein [Ktedonobacterales bacterium]